MKACFFDLDGTLLDSLEDLADAGNAALASKGYPTHPADAYRYFVGDGMETLIRRAAPQGVEEDVLRLLTQTMRDEYALGWARKTRPYPGITTMLDELRQRGVVLAVLSNKPHEFTELAVRRFFPNTPFARIQGSPKGGRAKPDPALALAMAAELGLAPEEVLFIGDSRTDMDTAVAAGMFPLGVLWGFRPASELTEHGAKALVEDPIQILDSISKR